MADVRWGRASWPGLRQVRRFTYTQSRGVTPSSVRVTAVPQEGVAFAAEGDFVIYDGVGTVTLRRCKFERLQETRGPSGREWELVFLDRRWTWRDCGAVKLFANQLDPQGKFVPWTIRSPVEMAQLCLNAMNETGYVIDLPVGLTSADGAGIQEFLEAGVNFPATGVNPPVDWFYARPASVLESLCQGFGRVVCLDWFRDAVRIARQGEGGVLPPGSIASTSPSIDDPKFPDGVAVAGCPTRFQGEFEVQPVGKEWNGTWKPINDLSYAPRGAVGKRHKVRIEGTFATGFNYYVTVGGYQVSADSSGYANLADLVAALAASLAGALNFNAPGEYTVTADATGITIEATTAGPQFDAGASVSYNGAPPAPANPQWGAQVLVVGAAAKGGNWERSWPPLFPGVRATNRLTLAQARALARDTVWKYYQLTGRSADRSKPLVVPGYGAVRRRQQIVLLDTQCEQVVPDPADGNVFYLDGSPWIRVQYDGFSRDKPAVCIGAVAKHVFQGTLMFATAGAAAFGAGLAGLNTGADDEVPMEFSVNPTFQMVQFPSPVYKIGAGFTLKDPELILRTACNVRDPDTNAFDAYEKRLYALGKSGRDLAWERHDDIQLNVIGRYVRIPFLGRRLVETTILEADPINRADYYLQGMLYKYQIKPSDVRKYNGIVPITLDGRISQLTWEGGDPEQGCTTTASINFEHDTAVPPFPARRRAENLRDAAQPGGFLGQVNDRQDPSLPAFPFLKPAGR